MDLSIVTSLYCSAPHLPEFHRRITKCAESLAQSFELIYVNDGSPDASLDIALDLFRDSSNVTVIDLSRNHQHHKALMCGLKHTTGDRVFLIDCDLEEEPELLTIFDEEYHKSSTDVVYGIQNTRKGGLFEIVSGNIYYALLEYLTDVEIPRNPLTARLMSRRYVDVLVQHTEREVYFGGILALAGFRQVAIPVVKHSCSPSTYSFAKKVKVAINGITSFSNKPLELIFYTGILLMGIVVPYLMFLMVWKLAIGAPVGFTTTIASIWSLGGIMIFMLGIIALYMSKIYNEVKQRPYTTIRHIWSPDETKRGDISSTGTLRKAKKHPCTH